MQKMEFDNNPYLIFRHHDTSHPHSHILALRTRFDGTSVFDSNNYKRSEKIIRELEMKFGLERVAEQSEGLERKSASLGNRKHELSILHVPPIAPNQLLGTGA